MQQSLADLRSDYALAALNEDDVPDNPLTLLSQWLQEALNAQCAEPTAMTLATTALDGTPDARIVLLKGLDDRGLQFFTHYRGEKGRQIEKHPEVALLLFWPQLQRQIRVHGRAQRLAPQENALYFSQRPRESQIGAWASPQSEVIANRAELEANVDEFTKRFADVAVPLPAHWGGYNAAPKSIEFWQGRPSRLHDRLRCTRENGLWRIQRLAP